MVMFGANIGSDDDDADAGGVMCVMCVLSAQNQVFLPSRRNIGSGKAKWCARSSVTVPALL